MGTRVYFYPIWIRLWHTLNAILFLLLIFSGFSMQYSSIESPFIRFDIAVSIHSIAGLVVTFNYLLFFFGNILSKNGRYYKMTWHELMRDVLVQTRFYLFGIFKKEPHPFPIHEGRKFNPLQKLTYIFALYIGLPLLIFTGLALYFPQIFNLIGLTSLIVIDVLHVFLGIVMTLFMLIHIYFCTMGHTVSSNFRSMLTGWHEIHE